MKKILLCLLALWVFPACATMADLPQQKTVDYVDIPRFMVRWYVIASIPTRFEKGAVNATETYTWNEAEDRVDIDFRYRQDNADGQEKKIPQKGFIYNHDTNAEWRVQPFWPLKFAYLIIDLAADYSDTVVGVPDRQNVWIMSQKPTMDEARYQELVKKVGALGYELNELKKVPQEW